MILIQFILIPLLLLLLVMYFVRLRSRFFMRAIALLVGILGIVLVARPEWSTVVSQALGVGRGADLITYLGLVGLSFASLLLYSKLRFLEMHLTSLIRAAAIAGAHLPQPPREEIPRQPLTLLQNPKRKTR